MANSKAKPQPKFRINLTFEQAVKKVVGGGAKSKKKKK